MRIVTVPPFCWKAFEVDSDNMFDKKPVHDSQKQVQDKYIYIDLNLVCGTSNFVFLINMLFAGV